MELLCSRSKTCAFSTPSRIRDSLLRAKSRASAGGCQLRPRAGEEGVRSPGVGSAAAQQPARLRSALSLQPRQAQPCTATHRTLSPGEAPTAGTERPAWGLSSRGNLPPEAQAPEAPQARLLSSGD